jgi:hypothetical protein
MKISMTTKEVPGLFELIETLRPGMDLSALVQFHFPSKPTISATVQT